MASEAQPDVQTDGQPDAVDNDGTVEAACSETSAPDRPDAKGEDSNCDGADGTVGTDVYLDPEKGDDSNSGTPQAPVATIARAVELASARDGAVLIAAGVLVPNALSLDTGLEVFGGYDASFLGEPERHRTTIQTGAEGWSIESTGSVGLHGLTVQGADAEGTTSGHAASAFALVLDVANAVLQDVDLQAGDAVPGTSGEPGEPGKSGIDATGKLGATGLTCFFAAQADYTDGADGSKPNAYGQPAGDLSSATAPQTGQVGYPGADGTNASGAPDLDEGTLFFGVAGAGMGDGTAGYGGPGGGGSFYGTCVEKNGVFYKVYGGGGGTGGCSGWGGHPATSGGGSVALLVRAGTVTVQGSRLATGFGGAGGDGGPGGTGGNGGRGAAPDVSRYATSCYDPGTTVDMSATCPPDETEMGCAGYGAAGGKGGDGGQGGAGAGGWTIGVLTAGAAAADLDSATVFDLGKPGVGGMGGAARAPDGQKAPSHHIDL
jgi:hypothetical protein